MHLVVELSNISINYLREYWKSPKSMETPFWCSVEEIIDGKWTITDRISRYVSSLNAYKCDCLNVVTFIALDPKPYLGLEDLAEDLANQVIDILKEIESIID